MKWNLALITVAAAVGIGAAGCSPPFPKELLEKVENNVPFTALQKDPDKYAGKLLMIGGIIVDTNNLKEG
ncbi:MAG: Outer rane lipoprotein Slp family, partial [Nitrospirae bacterium]|nr:Outer rane lipoprotein Slp family [Nitrospirota bacterium]